VENTRKTLGERGEALAVRYLRKKGYKILERNYRCRWGEIDLVASDKGSLVFIEIKTRASTDFGQPQEAVGFSKQKKLILSAKAYMVERHVDEETNARFDVVAVHLGQSDPWIDVIKDAFQL